MTKNRSLIWKARHLLVGLGLALAVGLVPSTAQAVTGGSASDLVSLPNLEGNQVYFGNYNGGNVNGDLKWYVVDSESPDAEGNNAITLWTGENFVYSRQSSDNYNWNNWENSDVKVWLNDTFYPTAFSEAEKSKISLYGISETNFYGDNYSVNEHVVLPSIREMVASVDSQEPGKWGIDLAKRATFNDNWLLRSPIQGGDGAAFVVFRGNVYQTGYAGWGWGPTVRPALKIPLDSILFTSSATSGRGAKSEVNVGDGLQAVTKVEDDARTTTPLKLTVIDKDSQKLTVSKLSTLGNQVTMDYKDATTGTNQSLSVILEDADGKVKYYGKLVALTAATNETGSASFSVRGLTAGAYTLKVFSEQSNGDNKTDVASEPAEYTLNITDQGMAQLPDEGVPTGEVIAFDGYEWYVIGSAENNALRVLLKSEAVKDGVQGDLPYAGKTPFDSAKRNSNHYGGSLLNQAMDRSVAMIENGKERSLIQERTLKLEDYIESPPYSNGIAGTEPVSGAKFWPLSTAEVLAIGGNTGSNIAKYSNSSWLRSPGNAPDKAVHIFANGVFNAKGVKFKGYNDIIVRPAFDIPLDTLLFTSYASGGSDSKGDGSNWVASDNLYTDGETRKFTVVDRGEDPLTLSLTNKAAIKKDAGQKLTLAYTSDDTQKTNNHVSAIIMNADGEVLYYQQGDQTAAEGEATFTLPKDIPRGDYKLKVFNEERNKGLYTDFTSEPEVIDLTIGNAADVQLEDKVAFDGYEWYVIGDGQNGVHPVPNQLSLFLKSDRHKVNIVNSPYIRDTEFSPIAKNNEYGTSKLREEMKNAHDFIENDREKELVQKRILTSSDGIAGGEVPDARFWPLSVAEANMLNNNIRMYLMGWWLRSPGDTSSRAAAVGSNGQVYYHVGLSIDTLVLRPAFDLPLDTLLFTSSASGKSGAIKGEGGSGSEAWKTVDSLKDTTNKFTMITDAITLTIPNPNQTFYVDSSDRELTIPYEDATSGPVKPRDSYGGNYISVLLTMSNGEERYLKADRITETKGSATIKLPAGIADGDYKLKVFNEEINETASNFKYTDFASIPIDLDVKVGAKPKVTEVDPKQLVAPLVPINQNTFTITFDRVMDKDTNGEIKLVPDEGETLTLVPVEWDSEGKVATYKMPTDKTLAHDKTYTYHISGFKTAASLGSMQMDAETTTYSFKTMAIEATPTIDIDFDTEYLTGFVDTGEYLIKVANDDSDTGTEVSATDKTAILPEWIDKELSIVKVGTDNVSDSSVPQLLKVPERQEKPVVTMTPASKVNVGDGALTVDSPATGVEYRVKDATNWTDYTQTISDLLENSTYEFRVKANKNDIDPILLRLRSEIVEKTVTAKPSITGINLSTNEAVSGDLIITFDRDMAETNGKIEIKTGSEEWQTLDPIDNPWTNQNEYKIHYENLTAGATYKVKVSGFKDATTANLEMIADEEQEFTIAAKPTVVDTNPNSTSPKVKVEEPSLTITFDQVMEKSVDGKVTLTGGASDLQLTYGASDWSEDGKTLTVKAPDLAYGTTYMYSIDGFVSTKGTKLDKDERFNFTTIGQETTNGIELDYVNETLTGLVKDARYQIDSEPEFDAAEEPLNISSRIDDQVEKTFDIVKIGVENESVNSDQLTVILPARPAAPSGYTVVPASTDTATDGKITGLTNTMEYKLNSDVEWKAVEDGAITELAKGAKVQIRHAASNTEKNFRSEAVEVVITDLPTVLSVETLPKVPRDGTLTITFSKPMDKDVHGTVMIGNATLDQGTWNNEGTIYTVNYAGLKDETTYQVTISEFKDQVDGNEMVKRDDLEITIGDNEPPKVESVTPAGLTVSVESDHLTILFDETIQPDSGTVTVDGLTIETPVFGDKTVTYDLSGLERNQTYVVKISGFADMAGNVMAPDTHEFNTEKSTYTIAFDKGADDATGTMEPQKLTYGSSANLATNTFARTGYHFTGWQGDNGGTYTDGQSVENLTEEHEATITLTAQWAPNSYQARFDANQGTGTIAEQSFEYGGDCVLPTGGCTREGYRLVGWSTLPTPTEGTTYDLGATIPWNFTNDTTFYAVWQAEHTVRFNPDNGDPVTEEKVLAGGLVTEPAAPIKPYHSFGGWFFNGSLYNFGLPVSGDMELTAQWNKVYHTVTFDANGGSGSTHQTVMSGTTATEPEVIYYGHRLLGWSTSQSGGGLWDFTSPVTDEVTLYAQWEAIPSYTLSFETNGGGAIADVTDFEDSVIELSNHRPTREGFIFDGWYSDVGLTSLVTQITLNANQTVYAKWQEITDTDRYILSFNSNGGSEIPEEVRNQDEVVPLAGYQPSRTGYSFAGWYDNAGLSGNPISSVTMTQHQTVYAKWNAESYQVSIELDGGAGDTTARPVTYDDSFTFPTADGYTKEGHQLIGWEIGDTRYEPGAVIDQWRYAGDQTMTAIWAKETYEIQFDSRGGSDVLPQYIQHGERVIEPSAPTRADHTFTGWYLTEDASGDPVDFDSYTATEATTLYAGWEATAAYYDVHFISRDGTELESIQVRRGEKAPAPESWEWEGYTFEGWFTTNGGIPIAQAKIEDTTTFEARWKAIQYNVTLRNPSAPQGEREVVIPYSRDDLKEFAEPTRRGYTFGGWREVSRTRATGDIHRDTRNLIGNCVLEAVWTADTYHVIFDTAGGENISPIDFTIEKSVDSLPKATRTGYLFQGWFDADGKEVTSIVQGTIGDQPLTARWLVDKTKLEDLVAKEAEKKRSANSYTDNSWKAYEAALAQAQTILDKEDATPQEVEEALAGLQEAIAQLTERGAVVQPDASKPSGGGTVTTPTTVRRVNQPTGQSTQRKSLAQTGEKETALYLILGLAIVGFVIPAWKKNRDAMK